MATLAAVRQTRNAVHRTCAICEPACSSGSDEAAPEQTERTPPQETTRVVDSRNFTKAELPELALQPADAPQGMRYTKVDSGQKTLLDVGIVLEDQVEQLRSFGFSGVYDATFDSQTTDVRLTERIWLFDDPEGAEQWFEKSRSEQQIYGFQEIEAPPLGQDSWAAQGNVGAAVVSYAFRMGNAVVVTSYSTQQEELDANDALAAAQKAEARLRAA